jgi:hypothetical protein
MRIFKEKPILIVMLIAVVIASWSNYRDHEKRQLENISVAVHFMKDVPDHDKYLKGIDFNKPINKYHVSKYQTFVQYQTPNSSQGNFYGFEESTPTELGISDVGWDPVLKKVVKKEKRVYVTIAEFDAMISYAAPVVDDWSTPEIETQTKGTARQLFTTCKDECFTFVNTKPITIYFGE